MRRVILLLACLVSPWTTACAQTVDFSAPPLLGPDDSRSLYGPLMELLTRETGSTFRYVHVDNWFAYQSAMQHDRFHLLLDDAHYASWRLTSGKHVALVKARERVRFVVLATRAGKIYSKEDLIGRTLCAYPQPDLGTISVLQKFNGPFQVPQILETRLPLDRVQRLLAGDCAGAVLARGQYTGSDALRGVSGRLKIVTQTDSYPGLTLTASSDMPDKLRNAIRQILLSRAGGRATRALRRRLANGSSFVDAVPEEYQELDELLRDFPGFGGSGQ